MKTSMLPRLFLISIGVAVFFGVAHPLVFGAGETDALKAQIQMLNDRIAVLEKQLSEKESLTPVVPHGHFSGHQDYSWDPFREMRLMQQRMNQLFDDSFDRSFGAGASGFLSPQTDIKAEDGRYVVTLDIPGMDKDTIDVQVKNGSLVVSGKRSMQKENKGDRFYSQQRSFGQFMKTLALPDDAQTDQVDARYEKGVLEIIIGREAKSKAVGATSRKITVK